jgi:hypothetical protein
MPVSDRIDRIPNAFSTTVQHAATDHTWRHGKSRGLVNTPQAAPPLEDLPRRRLSGNSLTTVDRT